jgi:hypothetical protein
MLFFISSTLYPHQLFQSHYGKSVKLVIKDLDIKIQYRVTQSGLLRDHSNEIDLIITANSQCVSFVHQTLNLEHIHFKGDQALAIQLKNWLKIYPKVIPSIAAHFLPRSLYSACEGSLYALSAITKQCRKYAFNSIRHHMTYEWGAAVIDNDNNFNNELSMLITELQQLKQQYSKPCTNVSNDSYS